MIRVVTLFLVLLVPLVIQARDCRDDLTGVKEMLTFGADHAGELLSGANDPVASVRARESAKTIKINALGADLRRAILSRAPHVDDPRVAGEIVFGLDVLRGADAERFASTVVELLGTARVRTSRYLAVILGRATFLVVSDKFATPGHRLPLLRLVLHDRAVAEAFLGNNNAGQWLTSLLATPGVQAALTTEDLAGLCGFAADLSLRRSAELRSNAIAAALAEAEWTLARRFAHAVQSLNPERACALRLDHALSTLERAGRAHHFATP